MRFMVLQDFWSEETQSQYCAGLTYEADKGMKELAQLWIKEGKAREGGPAAEVKGRE